MQGQPRHSRETASQASRIMVGATLAVALALKSTPVALAPLELYRGVPV